MYKAKEFVCLNAVFSGSTGPISKILFEFYSIFFGENYIILHHTTTYEENTPISTKLKRVKPQENASVRI